MKIKILSFVLGFLTLNISFGQSYFDFIYTNIPEAKFDNYSISNSNALGWIQTGNYSWPTECSNCYDYSRDSKLKKETLDSLVLLYKESGLKKIYSKLYVPNKNFFSIDKKPTKQYIIITTYRIEGDEPIPIFQIKVTFFERGKKKPGILNIQIQESKTMKVFDSKIVLANYRQKLKEDESEPPPTIQ